MERLWRDLEEQRTLARQLQHALNSRGAFEQAKGILAERHGATVGEAFAAMHSYARNNRRPLDDVAASVIASLASDAGRRPNGNRAFVTQCYAASRRGRNRGPA